MVEQNKRQQEEAQEVLVHRIEEAKQRLAENEDKQGSLDRSIREMEREVKRLTFDPQKERQRKSRQMRGEFDNLIQDQQRKNQEIEKRLVSLQREVEKAQNSFMEEEKRRRSLQAERTLAEAALASLAAQARDLKKEAQTFREGPRQSEAGVSQEINALRMQREALASSLAVIESQYNEDLPAIEEFSRDKKALDEYLVILREENDRLKQKFFMLESQFQGLSEKARR